MINHKNEAINLMLEDLYTIHSDIRNQAKVMNCEQELNDIRDNVIEYVKSHLNNN